MTCKRIENNKKIDKWNRYKNGIIDDWKIKIFTGEKVRSLKNGCMWYVDCWHVDIKIDR